MRGPIKKSVASIAVRLYRSGARDRGNILLTSGWWFINDEIQDSAHVAQDGDFYNRDAVEGVYLLPAEVRRGIIRSHRIQ